MKAFSRKLATVALSAAIFATGLFLPYTSFAYMIGDDYNEEKSTGNYDVKVKTKVNGSSGNGSDESIFVVKIPAQIVLKRKEYTTFEGTYTIGVKGVLGYGGKVYDILAVYPGTIDEDSYEMDTSFKMTGTSTGTTITATASQEKIAWVYDWSDVRSDEIPYCLEIKPDEFTEATGTITTTVDVADTYSGTLGFTITL